MERRPFFELRQISKYFARVVANRDISFNVYKGEVLALLGENGAGKSTIMKILYGLYRADEGQILMEGKEVRITSPKQAMSLGISMIQQHFSLVPAHSVVENIILGSVHGVIDYKKCRQEVEELCRLYHFDIPLDAKISQLDVGVQQKVEIVKALYLQASLLIMDEPTAVLTPQEAEQLMDFVRDYARKGNAVILITHKLKEVMSVADRILVMRAGLLCGDVKGTETDEAALSRLMIGEDLVITERESLSEKMSQPPHLSVRQLGLSGKSGVPLLDQISFDINAGEIFGIAGVSGNGQEELCEAIWGARKVDVGSITLDGTEISGLDIGERIALGIGYVPVDRYRDAMIMGMSLAENMLLKSSFDRKWAPHHLLDYGKLNQYTERAIEKYQIKAPGPEAKAGSLSGGNQQKVVLAREVDLASILLILNQPTRGLDLGAIQHVHTTILHERKAGKSILLVSTELSEIFKLCDRIAVMYKGSFMGIYRPDELDTQRIGLLMAGYREESKEAAR